MSDIKLTVIPNEKGELILRTGEAPKILNPVRVSLSGNIFTPLNWIEKRKALLENKLCHIVVNHLKGSIFLNEDENSVIGNEISGYLELHPDFTKWGINDKKIYSSFDLANMIKMNRSMLTSKITAMELVNIFQNLKIKVEKEIELSDDKRGNTTTKKVQAVQNMSIPQSFDLLVPLFNGFPPTTITVEIIINAETLDIQLISPQANDFIAATKENILTEQIEKIKELVSWIPIIHV